MHTVTKWITFFLASLMSISVQAQTFVKATDDHPLVAVNLEDTWAGVAWVDYDGDEDLDLFLVNRRPGQSPRSNKLIQNQNDQFVEITQGPLVNDAGYWFGAYWADYDNDGDQDCYVAGLPSKLYQNQGDGTFVTISSGAIAQQSNGGISAAWADYDNDGYLDLVLTWPTWMEAPPWVGSATAPRVFHNDGPPNFTFTLQPPSFLDAELDSYMQPSWYDYDEDGDVDLFIGMGSGDQEPDKMYRNLLIETGEPGFEPMTTDPIATDIREGQHWTWIDIDNDRDLDAFVTSWAVNNAPLPNDLYRNEGGAFVSVPNEPLVTDAEMSIGHIWGDFDNDTDLDCFVATDANFTLSFYQNDGSGHFTKIDAGDVGSTMGQHACASAGDFDNDGDLDVHLPGANGSSELFVNETNNGYHWIKLNLIGTESNADGFGAKIHAKSTSFGETVWQRRDLTNADTYFGHNSHFVHFGLGDAAMIDSLVIQWPSGAVQILTDVDANQLLDIVEENTTLDIEDEQIDAPKHGWLQQNYPNPWRTQTTIGFSVSRSMQTNLKIYNATGQLVTHLFDGAAQPGDFQVTWNGKNANGDDVGSGLYFYELQAGDTTNRRSMIRLE